MFGNSIAKNILLKISKKLEAKIRSLELIPREDGLSVAVHGQDDHIKKERNKYTSHVRLINDLLVLFED